MTEMVQRQIKTYSNSERSAIAVFRIYYQFRFKHLNVILARHKHLYPFSLFGAQGYHAALLLFDVRFLSDQNFTVQCMDCSVRSNAVG